MLLVITVFATIFPTKVFADTKENKVDKTNTSAATKVFDKEPKIIGEVESKREQNVKQFLMDDMTYQVAIYPEPVHYLVNGKWENIDNSLVEEEDKSESTTNEEEISISDDSEEKNNSQQTKEVTNKSSIYTNKKNDFSINISNKANSKKFVSIKKDKYEISWNLEKANKVEGQKASIDNDKIEKNIEALVDNQIAKESDTIKLVDNEFSKATEAANKDEKRKTRIENEKKKVVPNLSSTVDFKDVFDNIDLQYITTGSKLKENIIINKPTDKTEFIFNINANNLIPKLQKDNSIIFYDAKQADKVVFSMSSPFMYDAKGAESNLIKVDLKQDKSSYILTLSPNQEWIKSSERVYPITIDPPVETQQKASSIQDTFVCSNDTEDKYLNPLLRVGKHPTIGTLRTYIKFNLPALTSADMITNAILSLYYLPGYSTTSGVQINAHKVQANWNSSGLSWNNKPAYTPKIEDYNSIIGAGEGGKQWNITGIAKEWYSTGNNYGLMLKSNDEASGQIVFCSSDWSNSAALPVVSLFYVNNSGLESFWTYHSQDIGRAGTSYINDYNGNLVLVHDDLNMGGNRLPVKINHVYNNNEVSMNIGYGHGWRLNLSQTVTKSVQNDYWIYSDQDGTKHFFKIISGQTTLNDELNLGLKLTLNSDGSFNITDKDSNKLDFDRNGYLISLRDSNNNKLTCEYGTAPANGVRTMVKVTDGSGRVTTLNYNSVGGLTEIIDPSGRKTSYGYDGVGKLLNITYPDGKYTTYTYDSSYNLTSATNYDGYKMTFNYYDSGVFRVKKVLESHTNGTLGGELNITYGNNATSFVDVKGRKSIYLFDYWGKTINIKGEDGTAQYYKYDSNNVTKMGMSSKLQSTINNILLNQSIESDRNWIFSSDGGQGSSTYSSEDKYYGNRSIKVSKTDNVSKHYAQQIVTLQPGKTYTASAYAKTLNVTNANNGGVYLGVYYLNSSGVYEEVITKLITGTNNWQRMQLTFTLPSNISSNSVIIRTGLKLETGTVYFDDYQLEEGVAANRYNLVENGDFSYGDYGANNPTGWTIKNSCDGNDILTTSADSRFPQYLNTNCFSFLGDASVGKDIGQTVNISGKKGDSFILSGWAKGDSVPLIEPRHFALHIVFFNGATRVQSDVAEFNTDSSDWQYVSKNFIADADYTSVNVYIIYYWNANRAYFDGIQLYKEEFGSSYQYDSKGNVTSTKSLANQNSQFQYNGTNDLISSIDAKGNQFKYEYDYNTGEGKHNLTKATTAENVTYTFTYDSYGNPVTAKVGDSSLFIQSTSNYTASGNYIKSITDAMGNTVTYNQDESKDVLNSVVDAKNNTTSYGYDTINRLTSVTKNADGRAITNNYSYENDRIKSITHNGFSYNFGYDSLGNNTSVAAGSQNLITNSYEARTGKLLESTYGNGQKVSNDYDSYDKITAKKYNDNIRYSYQYDGANNLAYQKDIVNGVDYRYQYDLSDRLVNVKDSSDNSTSYTYDLNNNISNVNEKLGANSYTTDYSYDKDNKLKSIAYSRDTQNNISFNYDILSRMTNKYINTGSTQYNTTYSYVPGSGSSNVFLSYQSHVSNIGWQNWVNDGAISGTVGQNLQVEAIKISLNNPLPGMRIKYQAHVSNIGWQDWVYDGAMAGTTGQNLKVEAIRIVLEGAPAGYQIQYQAHVAHIGWQNVVTDGAIAGTTGQNLQLEAIRINLIKTGSTDTNRIQTVNNNGNSISYTYDKNGNIETIIQDGKTIKYYYNELNELIREDNAVLNKTITNAYDVGGNVTSKTEYPFTTGSLGIATKTYAYSYGDTNWKDKLTSFDGKGITYDAIGNPTTYNGYTYTWEEGRQLSSISGNGLSVSYKYNDSGIRTQKTINGVTTNYHFVGDKVTYEDSGTDKIYYTYDSSGHIVSMNLNGAEYYYIRNVQGDIIGLFDKTGTQVVSYVYDSWGKLISTTGTLASTVGAINPYRYRGYRYDTETGLYYLQSRYYNPEWGRFINSDALIGQTGELLGHNLFAYCKNNPVNRKDANGFKSVRADFSDPDDEPAKKISIIETVTNFNKEMANQRTNFTIVMGIIAIKKVKETVIDAAINSAANRVSNISLSRNAAFRAAKRSAGIPNSAQYSKPIQVYDSENRWVYQFNVNGRNKYIIEHREDRFGRGPHFHAADDKYGSPLDKIRYNQYPGHFPEDFNGYTD
jgi:RHS repeat-associated protein